MIRRLRSLSAQLTLGVKLAGVTAVLVGVIVGIMVLSVRSTSIERQRALVDNVAGRQPMLIHQYFAEVLLEAQGVRADAAATGELMLHDADALLDGGAVLAVQGNEETLHISAQWDPVVRAKLTELRRLEFELIDRGERLLADGHESAAFRSDAAAAEALTHLTANVAHDTVGRMTTETEQSVGRNARIQMVLAGAGLVLALAMSWLLGRRLVARLRTLADLVHRAATGDLDARYPLAGNDEVGSLGAAFNDMVDNVAGLVHRLEADASRESFGSDLAEALDAADSEAEAHTVIQRAMTSISAEMPMELLLADSSRAHLRRVAAHTTAGAPGCPVESPYSCLAVRRGGAVVAETSAAMNACTKLVDRPGGTCSAVCIPVSFMGKALGVLHTTGAPGVAADAEIVDRLTTLAAQAGSRIGTVRAFRQSQLQASTDGLTGLVNRRTLENHLRELLEDGRQFSLALADLDHFKAVNDTYGHEGGDRALRLFARTMRDAVRDDDIVARYGGEEFVFVFHGASTRGAVELIDRLRVILASTLQVGDTPVFTVSFGVTDSHAGGTIDELIRLADEALMQAKSSGRNRVVAIDPVAARSEGTRTSPGS